MKARDAPLISKTFSLLMLDFCFFFCFSVVINSTSGLDQAVLNQGWRGEVSAMKCVHEPGYSAVTQLSWGASMVV